MRGEHAPCDLSYIDGAHVNKGPWRDMKNAATASSDGVDVGWIFADDCTSRFMDVRDAKAVASAFACPFT